MVGTQHTCASWRYDENNTLCSIFSVVPLNIYFQDVVSGVKGFWSPHIRFITGGEPQEFSILIFWNEDTKRNSLLRTKRVTEADAKGSFIKEGTGNSFQNEHRFLAINFRVKVVHLPSVTNSRSLILISNNRKSE